MDQMREATLITAREHLEEVCAELASCPQIAFDTESNGFYAYKEKVCLVQISSPTDDYIVDPIAFKDLSALGPLMADPKIEKLFHAAEYDILCLKRDYGFEFRNLFDTMIAARVLGIKELGLAAAIERHFGIVVSKKLQRADWGRRPLTHEMIRYAQGDTHYLIRLVEIQKKLLAERGLTQDAAEACAELCALEPNVKSFDPEGYWRIIGRQEIDGRAVAALKEIWLYRENQAAARDRAPFRVMPEDLMVRVAAAMPETREALAAVKGMTPYILERFGSGLLACVERGRTSPSASACPTPSGASSRPCAPGARSARPRTRWSPSSSCPPRACARSRRTPRATAATRWRRSPSSSAGATARTSFASSPPAGPPRASSALSGLGPRAFPT